MIYKDWNRRAIWNSWPTEVTSRQSNVSVSWQTSSGSKMNMRQRNSATRNMEGLKRLVMFLRAAKVESLKKVVFVGERLTSASSWAGEISSSGRRWGATVVYWKLEGKSTNMWCDEPVWSQNCWLQIQLFLRCGPVKGHFIPMTNIISLFTIYSYDSFLLLKRKIKKKKRKLVTTSEWNIFLLKKWSQRKL